MNAIDHSRIVLDLEGLDGFGQWAWMHLACLAARSFSWRGDIVISATGLQDSARAVLASSELRQYLPRVRVTAIDAVPSSKSEFVFLIGSARFSRKLLSRFSQVYVAPKSAPQEIDASLYWQLRAGRASLRGLESVLQTAFPDCFDHAFEKYTDSIVPARPDATLITSVFNGDIFLTPFLENIAGLQNYERCQHLLIRPESPGNEHDVLVAHVRRHPSAVYINLASDPGLYDTWNLAARIADAPYLSSANLDDRRAPEHLSSLIARLEKENATDVASGALRVTETPNLDWKQSTSSPIWYGQKVGKRYTASSLVNRKPGGRLSHNIPHCMPVWRRGLHALHGYFRESAYGPSADWEFWLRTGTAGAGFAHVPKPLGLYLRNVDSYWRRDSRGRECDIRIAGLYTRILDEGSGTAVRLAEWPVTYCLDEVRELDRCGAHVELVARLLKCAWRIAEDGTAQAAGAAVNAFAVRYLGLHDLCGQMRAWPFDRIAKARSLSDVLTCIVGILHAWPKDRRQHLARQRPGRILRNALVDIHVVTRDTRALIGIALIERHVGRAEAERRTLRAARELNATAFWYGVRDVYHFEVPLEELVSAAQPEIQTDSRSKRGADINLWFYPDYSKRNPYQRLLYAELHEAGAKVQSLKHYTDIHGLVPVQGKDNVLHVHWIHPILKRVDGSLAAQQAARFLSDLRVLKRRGVKIYWTVHNALGHEAQYNELEREFRNRLARLVDRLYIHHPVVVSLLDWLPEDARLHLVEHGSYPIRVDAREEGAAVRRSLGFARDDVVLVTFGRFRDYKGFERCLPAIRRVMEDVPNLKLLVAGRITSRSLAGELQKVAPESMVLKNKFVSDDALSDLLCAADFAFLSYRAVLTSGSLFQALAAGLPVIAPQMGLIPAYICEDWNGYLYDEPERVTEILRRIAGLSSGDRDRLGMNALATARSLSWRFR